jgi:hypothetical protein
MAPEIADSLPGVHCPRCGSPNEPGDRYCAACGATLRGGGEPGERKPARERLSKLLGGDRKTRFVSLATIAALAVAAIGFIALAADEDSIPRDRYTLAAERTCLQAKRQIVAAGQAGGASYARQLVPIAVAWREELAASRPPADRREQAEELDRALREVEIEAATLARVSAAGERARTLAVAKRTDLASAEVERAIADLGLSECAGATLGFLPGE